MDELATKLSYWITKYRASGRAAEIYRLFNDAGGCAEAARRDGQDPDLQGENALSVFDTGGLFLLLLVVGVTVVLMKLLEDWRDRRADAEYGTLDDFMLWFHAQHGARHVAWPRATALFRGGEGSRRVVCALRRVAIPAPQSHVRRARRLQLQHPDDHVYTLAPTRPATDAATTADAAAAADAAGAADETRDSKEEGGGNLRRASDGKFVGRRRNGRHALHKRTAKHRTKAVQRHRWLVTESVGKFNAAVVAEWLASPGIRSRMDMPVWVFLKRNPQLRCCLNFSSSSHVPACFPPCLVACCL